MAHHVIRQFTREVFHAFVSGGTTFTAFGKVFHLDHVSGHEWRVTSEDGDDIGLRFVVNDGKLEFAVC